MSVGIPVKMLRASFLIDAWAWVRFAADVLTGRSVAQARDLTLAVPGTLSVVRRLSRRWG